MSDIVGMIVYVADTSDYDNRGGCGTVYATLEGAKAASPGIVEWLHRPPKAYEDGFTTDDEWEAVCPRAYGWSAGDAIPIITAQVVRP